MEAQTWPAKTEPVPGLGAGETVRRGKLSRANTRHRTECANVSSLVGLVPDPYRKHQRGKIHGPVPDLVMGNVAS